MKTELLNRNDTKRAGEILKNGGLVAIPTETVYGLAADAFDGEAVKKIFEAKGRPQDNPLIVHIADISELSPLVNKIPDELYALADKFWPGPLTIIMEKSSRIPDEVSAGLPSVAIRMPSHPVARQIIKDAGVPLAAPSANTSGKPSPTTAAHVIHDMDGKIDAILDGGRSSVGVESTVITLCTNPPRLLRPGGITPEQIAEVIGKIDVDEAVLGKLKEGVKAASPGMKYKHYSPNADVIIVDGTNEEFKAFIDEKAKTENNIIALVFDEELESMNCRVMPFGKKEDDKAHAAKLFAALRECDELGISTVYVHRPSSTGVGLAVMNRLLRAAEYRIITLK